MKVLFKTASQKLFKAIQHLCVYKAIKVNDGKARRSERETEKKVDQQRELSVVLHPDRSRRMVDVKGTNMQRCKGALSSLFKGEEAMKFTLSSDAFCGQ